MEKDFGPLQNASNDLVNRARAGTLNDEEALKSIDSMIGRVESLKRKVRLFTLPCLAYSLITSRASIHNCDSKRQLSDLNENAGKPTLDVMRERLNHLATIESIQSTAEPEFSRWADTRLDRWLVDWTLRNGKERTAKRIARDKDIEV